MRNVAHMGRAPMTPSSNVMQKPMDAESFIAEFIRC